MNSNDRNLITFVNKRKENRVLLPGNRTKRKKFDCNFAGFPRTRDGQLARGESVTKLSLNTIMIRLAYATPANKTVLWDNGWDRKKRRERESEQEKEGTYTNIHCVGNTYI